MAVRVQALNQLNIRSKEDMKSRSSANSKSASASSLNPAARPRNGAFAPRPGRRQRPKGYVIKYFSDKTGDYIVFRNQCR